MLKKLTNTDSRNFALTILRLALGIVFFLSRIAAFGILCNMLVAVFMVHRQFGFFANWSGQQKGEGIEYHLLAIAITLAIMIAGSGALSVDAALSGRPDRRL